MLATVNWRAQRRHERAAHGYEPTREAAMAAFGAGGSRSEKDLAGVANNGPETRAEHTMNEEGMEEERRWSGDFVPVAIYSSVIFVLLVLYVRYL
jgi:hypothetical protein